MALPAKDLSPDKKPTAFARSAPVGDNSTGFQPDPDVSYALYVDSGYLANDYIEGQ